MRTYIQLDTFFLAPGKSCRLLSFILGRFERSTVFLIQVLLREAAILCVRKTRAQDVSGREFPLCVIPAVDLETL